MSAEAKPQAGTTLPGLHAFLQVLRQNRVRRFNGVLDADPVEIEFEAEAPSPGPPIAPPIDLAKCDCGHPAAEHNESGECLRGCPIDNCSST